VSGRAGERGAERPRANLVYSKGLASPSTEPPKPFLLLFFPPQLPQLIIHLSAPQTAADPPPIPLRSHTSYRSPWQVQQLIDDLDADHDGKVSWDEFRVIGTTTRRHARRHAGAFTCARAYTHTGVTWSFISALILLSLLLLSRRHSSFLLPSPLCPP
jgi:hypothetical protein